MKALVASLLALLLVDAIKGSQHGDGHCKYKRRLGPRPHSVTLTEFGAVGDGVTLNTLAFQNAIFYLKSFADKGGAQLYVPKGKWLTGCFNLTSHLTLFLDKGAVIMATQDLSQWPPIGFLPSYGRGIELPGDRFIGLSLLEAPPIIHFYFFRTGDNGTIDGRGSIWWDSFRSHSLNYSRPDLIELINSDAVLISNLTFLNPPAWTIHPVYCRFVFFIKSSSFSYRKQCRASESNNQCSLKFSTYQWLSASCHFLPISDSSSEICIEDCTITVGHDAISLKSGWDEYGISYSKPSSNIYITNVFLSSLHGSALAFGSEMSGGISGIHADHLHIYNSNIAIDFRTALGRGGFMENIVISYVDVQHVRTAIQFTGNCSSHPDERYDPKALPIVDRVTIKNVIGTNISVVGALHGIEHDPFTAICLSNIHMTLQSPETSSSWTCSNVSGFSEKVSPEPCSDLMIHYSNSSLLCYSLENFKYSLASA
ncbi:putative polygalacturonase [Apostasia shenzhenica]|uniref:Putative polygalacturonase n=1 Tax=Apostasia shenzhenica TaxID=1088818 RepID=A0A2I0B5D0_9ASPA|nr:putative polygalacturonase [Apostasia shenzhenica]